MQTKLIAALAATAFGCAVNAQDIPGSAKVGTSSQGGTYFVYGSTWGGMVQNETGVSIGIEATGGPTQNMALVHLGDLDFGMTTMGPAFAGISGENPVAPGVEMTDVRAVFPMYQTPFQILTLDGSGIESFDDLAGHKVGVGPNGSTASQFYPQFSETLGVTFDIQYGGAGDLGGQLQDGLIDVFAYAAGMPVPAFSQVAAQADAQVITFSDEQIASLLEDYPSLSSFTIPAGTYQGQDAPVSTVAMWNFAIANKDVSADFVYEVTKVVLENNADLVAGHRAGAETLLENWDKNTFLPFHAGTVRYLKEQGIEVPANLIPPEFEG
ncbi:TAXI family TRAP transporter solute-binding subunit [Marinibacterium sp. SX1]|uniref:TAXI family TRAP transporter solute-binding subunit n=1 Tax=Marinibacterium sp. SX1 TaxID=3388424 RepID=UPI003D16B2A0